MATGRKHSTLTRSLRAMLFLCGFFFLFASCNKGGCNVIPNVSVLERVSLVEYQELRIPNQAITIDRGGVAGLVVVYLGNNQYMAYDRCSTVAPEKKCAVTVDGMIATDPCSGAKYILINGSPAEIAECPLKPYRAVKSGETILISN